MKLKNFLLADYNKKIFARRLKVLTAYANSNIIGAVKFFCKRGRLDEKNFCGSTYIDCNEFDEL